ncbi:MAG: Gfo/Idh/MocA family oxidoreductase [Labilithrix sp.]|nr:Gfo/Idh/MocA family oxidoreductase [Labilithrix sp.]MCW5814754.1 Gfo/Idh/MocA family oxidoreductase [Labilithrix sp.]
MLRFALVGCGRIAERHAQLLATKQVANAMLVGVTDIVPERAAKFGAVYGVPHFTDMDEMMTSVHPDVVVVLTPSGLHAEHVIRLSRHGKAIVCEKPMALTLDDADAMIAACDHAGCKLFIVKQNRWNLPVRKLREAMDAGRFGKLVMGTIRVRWCRKQEYYDQDSWRGTWRYDGGILANQASHHVDLLEWLMGSVESVFAKSSTSLVNVETEDTAVAVLRFTNGALGVIEATTATRPDNLEGSVSVLGEGGTVEIAGFAVNEMRHWSFVHKHPGDEEILKRFSVNPPNVYGFGHQAYLEHVVDCVANGAPALVDGLEGRKSLELITALYESIETGEEVRLRFKPRRSKLGHEK